MGKSGKNTDWIFKALFTEWILLAKNVPFLLTWTPSYYYEEFT